jgi:hypothetical protein
MDIETGSIVACRFDCEYQPKVGSTTKLEGLGLMALVGNWYTASHQECVEPARYTEEDPCPI